MSYGEVFRIWKCLDRVRILRVVMSFLFLFCFLEGVGLVRFRGGVRDVSTGSF